MFDILYVLDRSLNDLLDYDSISDRDGDVITIVGVTDAQDLRYNMTIEEFTTAILDVLHETNYMRFPDCDVRLHVMSCTLGE